MRQLLGRRREDSQSSISETKPALYKDETGALYTVDSKTGQMVPYGTSSAPTNEFDSKDTKIAEYELKDGVRSVLDEYPNLSISEKQKILANPFRWWMYNYPDKTPEEVSVDEVLLDIEFKLMEDYNTTDKTNSAPEQSGKGFRVAPSNTTPQLDLSGSPLQEYITDDGQYDIDAINSAIDRKDLSLKDLEKVVRNTPMHEVLKGQKSTSNRGMFKKMI